MNKKQKITIDKPSSQHDFLVKSGLDEAVALEIDEYEKKKGKRRKRMEIKSIKEDRWK
jgi:hypothetical protein